MSLIGIQLPPAFFLGSPVGVFISMPPLLAPSEVLLERFFFWVFPLGISIPPCVNSLFLLLVFLLLYFEVNKLNPVQHKFLHLWRTFVACWIFWGKTLSVWYSSCSFFVDVCLMVSVVLHFRSYVSAIFSLWCPWCSIVYHIVNHYSCPLRG